jgi:hypothetical protein
MIYDHNNKLEAMKHIGEKCVFYTDKRTWYSNKYISILKDVREINFELEFVIDRDVLFELESVRTFDCEYEFTGDVFEFCELVENVENKNYLLDLFDKKY